METTREPARLTARLWLQLYSKFIKKYSQFKLNELDDDIARVESLDAFQQAYLHAYWGTIQEGILALSRGKVDSPVSTLDQLEAQRSLVEEFFGIHLRSPGPSSELKTDVAKRLEWYKQCVAKDFEQAVFGIVDRHSIESPIEQIFLMEWCYAKVEDRYQLKLHPQKPIRTESGEFFLDYMVTSADDSSPKFAVAIELDGHEFHEKTKQQVLEDKRRERAILHAGINERLSVLRFSGSEVVRNCANCIKEVVNFVEKMRESGQG